MTFKGILAAAALATTALALPAWAQPAATPAPAATTPPATPAPVLRHVLQPDAFVYQSPEEVHRLTHEPDGRVHSATVSDHENYWVEYVTRRDKGNNPETHGHWYDYIHVLDGEGSITVGGTQEGGRDTGLNEIRGGTLVGAKTIILKPGSRLVLPPGLPHLFTATPGNTFSYLIFKVRF